MARINNLTDFLTDVASAIKTKKGSQTDIPAANFDTEIASIDTVKGEQITINPSTSQQIVTPSSGKNAITQATVNAVTNSIDANIIAGNIKNGVTILGVTGTYEGSSMKEYASVAAMNAAIATIAEGEVVKVTTGPTYYIKDTGVMVQLVKETETLTPIEYNSAVVDTNAILGE